MFLTRCFCILYRKDVDDNLRLALKRNVKVREEASLDRVAIYKNHEKHRSPVSFSTDQKKTQPSRNELMVIRSGRFLIPCLSSAYRAMSRSLDGENMRGFYTHSALYLSPSSCQRYCSCPLMAAPSQFLAFAQRKDTANGRSDTHMLI